ncbi:hypothetical protein CKAH01_08067 [Colletotrichum kahawae]|uniref:Uncharacterized protein n=1 Tax=Colletotrichum kahawae TaxID=34407 RepID=A0AAD9Y1U2_COLKA|nr:hypothetical protein CKAH01_08067 [Colletotrichum kahawae]
MGDIRGGAPIWSYLATLNNATANSLVHASLGDTAHQSLILPKLLSNTTSVSAIVDVFIPSISCQDASLSLARNPFTDVLSYYRFNSSSCSSDDLLSMRLNCQVSCENNPRIYAVEEVDCSSHDMRVSESSEPDIRYAIAVADLETEGNSTGYSRINIKKARAAMCKIGYGMVSANLTNDILSGEATFNKIPVLESSPKHLPNLTNQDLAEKLIAELNAASTTLLVDPSIAKLNTSSYESFSFFQLLAAQLKLTREDAGALLQPSLLRNLSTVVFKGVSVEFAKKALLVEDTNRKTFEAVAHVSENRLYLRHYTLWPIVSGFFLLSLFCIFLSFLIPSSENQLDATGSIASYTSILANSPTLLVVLKDLGHYRSSQLKRKLENMHFIINTSRNGPRIEAFGSTRKSLPGGSSHSKKRPWRPLPASLPMVVLCFGLPLFTISLLEILQRLSDRHHGLFDFDSSNSATPSYAIRLASTLLAFLIATLFNNLDFAIAVFTPYSLLRSGSVPAHRSISSHVLRVSPFLVLVNTFRLRQFGSAASHFCTLLASFLTIIVSGLWVMGDPVQISSVSPATIQSWDTKWLTNNHDDQGASVTLNIIRHGGANITSYIKGYDVFPKLSLGTTTYLDTTKHTYDTTVLRPILHCETVPQSKIRIEPDVFTVDMGKIGISAPTQFMRALITLNKTVSTGCSVNSSGHGDMENLVGRYQVLGVETKELSTRGVWIGQQMDLEATPGESKTACPSTAFLFGKLGYIEGNGPEMKNNNLTALFCSQKIEEIPATITYLGNPTNVNVDHIQLHSDRAKYWINGTTKSANLAFKTKDFLESGLTGFPISSNHTVQYVNDLDLFFEHIIFGPRGVSPSDILGPSNAGALTEAVTHAFKEYFAHVIDLNFRSKDSETSIQGTSLRTTTRLAIHRVSKTILQSLLAATTVLSFVGYNLVKIRGTLPRNPCSIASTMGFLADSQLCDPKTGILLKMLAL